MEENLDHDRKKKYDRKCAFWVLGQNFVKKDILSWMKLT